MIFCKYSLASLFLFFNSHCMQFARQCNCPQSIELLEIIPQNIKVLANRFSLPPNRYIHKIKAAHPEVNGIYFCRGLRLRCFWFFSVVQGRNHIDRLIHRAALVADDRAITNQHVTAAPECLGVSGINDVAFHTQLHAAVRHDCLHYCTS